MRVRYDSLPSQLRCGLGRYSGSRGVRDTLLSGEGLSDEMGISLHGWRLSCLVKES